MVRHQWLRALPLVVMAALAVSKVEAGEIHDRAGMFSAEAVKKARAELDRIEQKTGISVLIETIDSIPGLDKKASANIHKDAIETFAERRAREAGSEGVYLLLSKNDKLSSQVLVRERYEPLLPREARQAVREAMLAEFKTGNYDQGLLKAVETMDRSLASAPAGTVRLRGGVPAPAHGLPRRANADGGKFGVGTLLVIGLGIFGVLLLLRVLRGAFGQPGGGYPAGMGGMPRPGMGPGPGYGAPGYGGYGGGRGGGFFSGMLGGLGGALAGNWLYDQFSGRHGGHTDASSYPVSQNPDPYGPGGDEFVGGNDEGGGGASWGDSGAADTGGDWGGGGGDGGDW
jgi:uncharacterized membrane protein YgcG